MFFSFVKEKTRWLLYAEKLLGPWVFVVFRREFLHPMHKFYNFLRAKGLPWLLWAKLTLASLFPAVTRSCHYYFWPPSSAARVFAPCQSMREMRFIVFVKKIYYALCMNPKLAQQSHSLTPVFFGFIWKVYKNCTTSVKWARTRR